MLQSLQSCHKDLWHISDAYKNTIPKYVKYLYILT